MDKIKCSCGCIIKEINPKTNKPYLKCKGCRRRKREYHERLKAEGKCRYCRKPSSIVVCETCRTGIKAKLKAEGKCGSCGGVNDTEFALCSKCTFKGIARRSLKDVNRWQEIKTLLEDQNYICAVTKLPIKLGEGTASLDHIVPKSGEGTHNIDNLRWVHTKFNKLKQSMTDNELLDMIKLIIKNKKNLILK